MKQVLVYMAHPWHGPNLTPIYERLRSVAAVHLTADIEEIRQRRPDIVLIADAGLAKAVRRRCRRSIVVHVCHGIISKGHPGLHYSQADYVCLPSPAIRDRLLERGISPKADYWVTGMIQMDSLFAALKSRTPRAGSPTVLYAPTWNSSLSSADMFSHRLVELIRGDSSEIRILIKPHPHIEKRSPHWMAMWRDLANRHPNVTLVDPPSVDLMPFLLEADMMVSDTSSAAFQYLALDRPIVLVENPARFEDQVRHDPRGIEWEWRGISDSTSDVSAVAGLVKRALADPKLRQAKRQEVASLLFSTLTDGGAAARVVDHILGLPEKKKVRGFSFDWLTSHLR